MRMCFDANESLLLHRIQKYISFSNSISAVVSLCFFIFNFGGGGGGAFCSVQCRSCWCQAPPWCNSSDAFLCFCLPSRFRDLTFNATTLAATKLIRQRKSQLVQRSTRLYKAIALFFYSNGGRQLNVKRPL